MTGVDAAWRITGGAKSTDRWSAYYPSAKNLKAPRPIQRGDAEDAGISGQNDSANLNGE